MVGQIGPTETGNRVQPVVLETPTKEIKKSGKFKHWIANGVALCKRILLQKPTDRLGLPRKREGIDIGKIIPMKERVISNTAGKLSSVQQQVNVEKQVSIEEQVLIDVLQKKPTTIDECDHLIRMLESDRESVNENYNHCLTSMLKQIDRRINILKKRLVNTCSKYNDLQLKRLETEAALDLIPEKEKDDPMMAELITELTSRIEKLNNAAMSTSKMKSMNRDELTDLKNYPKTLIKIMDKAGLKVTTKDIKHSVVARLNREPWHEINKVGSVIVNDKEYCFQQQCTPACQITWQPKAARKDDSDSKENAHNIFPEDYQGTGVTAHAIKNTTHATNLFTSRLTNQDTGKDDLAIVRHGVNSPYGLKPSQERTEGSLNRAKEVVVAALSLKPELLEKACQGEVVSLMVTSSCLLTPDPFRKFINPMADERSMLKDQLTAYRTLCNEKPVILTIKAADGVMMEVQVDLELIPFNIGVNSYAVDASLDSIGGWDYSDSINNEAIMRLIGSTSPDEIDGGVIGQWLRKNEEHPDAEVVKTLVRQVQAIYRSQAHKRMKGGAYKLASRLISLTWLVGGVPCTNCKSGKDRTSMSVVAAEALIAYIRLYHTVPEWNEIGEDQSHLVRELCFQGAHHDIQRMNTGAAGFKIEEDVLEQYNMSQFEMDQIRGLADFVPTAFKP